MEQWNDSIDGRSITVYETPNPQIIFIQPVDEHDASLLGNELKSLSERTTMPFALAALEVRDWSAELSPWEAPAVFGKEAFAGCAYATLCFIGDRLLPILRGRYSSAARIGIGGYSLAGLFALWAGYETDLFTDIAAVSPSVWFPNWVEYAERRWPLAERIYLSLGDKEEKVRNPIMASVGDRIREQYARLMEMPSVRACTLEWNEGNHFRDSDLRTAKGFAWLTKQN